MGKKDPTTIDYTETTSTDVQQFLKRLGKKGSGMLGMHSKRFKRGQNILTRVRKLEKDLEAAKVVPDSSKTITRYPFAK